jgi:spermidine synthase
LAVSFSDPRVTVLHDDGARHLREGGVRYDAILVDSTDPVGPARSLSTPEFFTAAAGALTDRGLFAMQTESLHYHVDFVNEVQRALREVFASVDLYAAPIATYAGNWWTFGIASKSRVPREPVRVPVPGTRIYCQELHRSAFVPAKALACFTALGSPTRRGAPPAGTRGPDAPPPAS